MSRNRARKWLFNSSLVALYILFFSFNFDFVKAVRRLDHHHQFDTLYLPPVLNVFFENIYQLNLACYRWCLSFDAQLSGAVAIP